MTRSTQAFEIDGAGLPPLGMPADRFLREFWQKRPLLIRQAFPEFASPLGADDLAGLACEDTALARLVRQVGDDYTVEHGPFPESRFADLPERDWTLLVQDVDSWDADVRALLAPFDFLPRWRIDDVMVSYAAPGGSVGAHVDRYDVFLLQASGRRRWAIDDRPRPDDAVRADSELRLLQRFRPTRSWSLAPGDMLYLPPGMPHHGIAEAAVGADGERLGDCLTFSFGMRAPSHAELLLDAAEHLAARWPDAQRYSDADLRPAADPFEIDAAALNRLRAQVPMLAMLDAAGLRDWFGCFITTYRAAGEPLAPSRPPNLARIEAVLTGGGRLRRNPFARLAWARAGRSARLYGHGRSYVLPVSAARRLAAAESLDATDLTGFGEPARAALLDLVRRGLYRLTPAGPRKAGSRRST